MPDGVCEPAIWRAEMHGDTRANTLRSSNNSPCPARAGCSKAIARRTFEHRGGSRAFGVLSLVRHSYLRVADRIPASRRNGLAYFVELGRPPSLLPEWGFSCSVLGLASPAMTGGTSAAPYRVSCLTALSLVTQMSRLGVDSAVRRRSPLSLRAFACGVTDPPRSAWYHLAWPI